MNQSRLVPLRIILIFAVVFSLSSLPGILPSSSRLPVIPSVQALPAPCPTHGSTGVCSEYWLPAGSAMDTLTDIAMVNCPTCLLILSPPPPDLTDSPVPPNQVGAFNASSSVYLTAPINGAQFAYLSNWQRVINDESGGIPNFFTWLDARSSNPQVPGTIRQAFSHSTTSVNPYVASTVWDSWVVGNIYDSLYSANPLNHSQFLDWMTVTTVSLSNSSLTYAAPPHTVTTYRFTLRSDMFFQDGRKVTSYDVAFSYLSTVGLATMLSQGASTMTGITVLGLRQFDIGVNQTGPFVLPNLASVPIVPGRYWTNAGSNAWDVAVNSCTTGTGCPPVQYTLSGATVKCALSCTPSTSLMTVNPTMSGATFDPISNHILIGSGPWQCGLVTSLASGSCSSSGDEHPPLGGSYSLVRFGSAFLPGSTVSGDYFRSNGNLALWFWSQDNGDLTHDFLNFATIAQCFGQLLQVSGPCTHFQQGIGTNGIATPVGLSQVSILNRFVGVNWVSPFDWRTNPPTGIIPLTPNPPILYAGVVTLNPASVIGCPGGYDC